MLPDTIQHSVLQAARRGHFRYESGHHGDLWLNLDALLADARRTQRWAAALAARAAACRPDVVCGPLTGGAFVAQFMAAEIGIEFVFAERHLDASGTARYGIPAGRRAALSGRRVLLVDDAVNAGSALLATAADLAACDAAVVGFASLIALGDAAPHLSAQCGVPFFTLASLERRMWRSQDCPLCQAQVPLEQG